MADLAAWIIKSWRRATSITAQIYQLRLKFINFVERTSIDEGAWAIAHDYARFRSIAKIERGNCQTIGRMPGT